MSRTPSGATTSSGARPSAVGSAQADAALLDVVDLHAGYGRSPVLFGIGLSVQPGEIVGLLGRNGMGKTTLVRAIAGLLHGAQGQVRFGGADVLGQPSHRIARLGLGLVPEGRQVFPNLTVAEHLTAFARAAVDGGARAGGAASVSGGGSRDASRAGETAWTPQRLFELFPRLAERQRNLGSELSGGEQQMLAIARALVTNPRLLILDEATEGLAPLVREEIWRVLGVLREAGHAMIVIDKYVKRLIPLADRHVILEKGRVAWTGSSAELDADHGIWHRYLGL